MNKWKPVKKKVVPSVRLAIRFRNIGTDAHFSHVAIPKPYPTALPQGQEEAETYYVVDCGREVGIFTDK